MSAKSTTIGNYALRTALAERDEARMEAASLRDALDRAEAENRDLRAAYEAELEAVR